MSKPVALTEEQIARAMTDLPGWTYDNHKLTKTFVFGGAADLNSEGRSLGM